MMIPRQGRLAVRQTAQQAPTPKYIAYSFPGPSQGWVSDQNLAMSQPGAAYILRNILPTTTGGMLRRGCIRQVALADEAGVTSPIVRDLMSYESGAAFRLFAGVDGGIFDVSAQDSPSLAHAVSKGHFSEAQYSSTDGTRYVRGVNGVDEPWVYDGTSFSTSPALTFPADPGVPDPEDMEFTWVYRNRFFFIQRESLEFWYLPVGQIGGELTRFSLGGEFRLGGHLIFGGTWSIESGDGLNAFCVFITDKGEVAVYKGSNPGDANDWMKVGVYVVGRPKGRRAIGYRGGDLLMATDMGLIALSASLQKDTVTIALSAISSPVENEWRQFSLSRAGSWPVEVWSEGQMLTIALPTGPDDEPIWLVANARTNRWTLFDGWNATCQKVHNNRLYYGTPDGRVFEANAGGSDDGRPYTGVYVPVFDQMGAPGLKTAHMARAVVRSTDSAKPVLSVQSDFTVNLPARPDSFPIVVPNAWGTAEWGVAEWGDPRRPEVVQDWENKAGKGEVISIAHQITSGSPAVMDTEFIRTDVLFTVGEMQS